ncbi:MAG: galactose-1-phosphate uridylyltransferase [Pseudomonadota bacterium]
MPELRKDIVTREWVILAKERAKRPKDFKRNTASQAVVPAFDPACPFCPGNEALTPAEVMAYRGHGSAPNSSGWRVRVTPNKFAALDRTAETSRQEYYIYDHMQAAGAHEVVIETPLHNVSPAYMDARDLEHVLWAYIDRYNDLKQDPRIKYILIFRNHGELAGCSLAHPHSQIVATPIIPQKMFNKVRGLAQYREYREKCAYCDILNTELERQERLVSQNGSFVVLCPFASRSPFETWIVPRAHTASFADMNRFDVMELAEALKDTLLRLDRCLDNPPYNYQLITAPIDGGRYDDFHWYLEIIPRLTTPAGLEMGTSIYINVTPPEDAARFLREALDDAQTEVVQNKA